MSFSTRPFYDPMVRCVSPLPVVEATFFFVVHRDTSIVFAQTLFQRVSEVERAERG